jgi:mRNA interferase RelE/StbE
MAYTIEFAPAAARQFTKLPRDVQRRLRPRIDALAVNPRPFGSRKLAGVEELWRIRVGDYRIVYQIRDKLLVVLVLRIGHRREIYK